MMAKIRAQISKVKRAVGRVVKTPPDLEAALAGDAAAKACFAGLSPSCKREYVQWIESAKREETRRGRVEKVVGMLARGEKRM